VQALALPEFTTMPRRCPRPTCFFVTTHGAAITWFVVNTPAAWQCSAVDAMTATSSRAVPAGFTPAATAPATNPRANVTP